MKGGLPDDFDVDYELVRFVRRARAYAIGQLSEIHPDLDYNTFVLLLAIRDTNGGVQASELAEEMAVHKSTVSRAVGTMERLGLIERVTHPDDGRARILTVTDDTKARIDAFRISSHAWLADRLTDWTAEERATFARLLARLNDAAENDPPQPVVTSSTVS